MDEKQNNKESYFQFLTDYQYRRKLSPIFFFLTGRGILWTFFVYFIYTSFSFIFFIIIVMWSFLYLIKNHYNYLYSEKESIYLFKKFYNFVKGSENDKK